MKTFLWGITVVIIMMTAYACSPFSPRTMTGAEGNLPEMFSLYTPGTPKIEKWWEDFHCPELNSLIETAFSSNLDLQAAWARLKQAEALAVQSGASLYPDLSLSSDISGTRRRYDDGSDNGKDTRTLKDYSLGLISSYELDLWGRIRSENQAARLAATATREDLNTAAMTLAAEITERWINIINQRMQKELLAKQLQINQTYLELVELRFRKSIVSALDVYQQKQIVEQVKAEIPLVKAEEQLLLHEMALLLGKPPGASIPVCRSRFPEIGDLPATGLPSDLLANRPDVRAAGLRLKAAEWQVAAARADRLPAIRLRAEAGYHADDLDLVFDNWLLQLAANLTAPLFDGRQRAAEVDRSRAAADEDLAIYRRTVYTAIKEVEDVLVRETRRREHIQGLELEIDAARKALIEARQRYRKGIEDYLPVLTQLLKVQNLERTLIQRRSELLIDRIGLYRSLGGTWAGMPLSEEKELLHDKG